MASSNQLFFFFALLLPIISPISSNDDLITEECGKTFTYNDILQSNINSTILDLVTKVSVNGFANSSHGVGNDIVYGLAECRGDISGQTCSECVVNAAQHIRTTCPNAAESRIRYQLCFLRYSTSKFFGQLDMSEVGVWYVYNMTDPQLFKQTLDELLMTLWLAASHEDDRKFAWGEIRNHSLKNNDKATIIHGMTHCTWHLDETSCFECLGNAFRIITSNCGEGIGCYVITESCAVRYEIDPFLFLNALPNPTKNSRSITFGNI